jgi:hypothetical protein
LPKQHLLALEKYPAFEKKYLSNLLKSFKGYPTKLSPYNIYYTTCFLGSEETEIAFQIAKRLVEINSTTISNQAV